MLALCLLKWNCIMFSWICEASAWLNSLNNGIYEPSKGVGTIGEDNERHFPIEGEKYIGSSMKSVD